MSRLRGPVIRRDSFSLGASVVAGIAAVLGCWVAPLLLVMAGLGGTWLSMLRTIESLRPLFIVAALLGTLGHKKGVSRPSVVWTRSGDDCDRRCQKRA